MATNFIPRQEKSSWGIPANQNATGELFVGKGWGTPFSSQFPPDITTRVARCLAENRGNRNGHFWVNLATKTVRMQIGDGADNKTQPAKF